MNRINTTPTTTPIRHFLMIKPIASLDDIRTAAISAAQLQQARYQHIPLSEKMGCAFSSIPGKIITTMPEAETRIRTIRYLPAACFRSLPNRLGLSGCRCASAPWRHDCRCAYPLQQADQRAVNAVADLLR